MYKKLLPLGYTACIVIYLSIVFILNAGKIAELSGLDRKEVDAAMKQLKAEGAIVSPVRCKWAPAE